MVSNCNIFVGAFKSKDTHEQDGDNIHVYFKYFHNCHNH